MWELVFFLFNEFAVLYNLWFRSKFVLITTTFPIPFSPPFIPAETVILVVKTQLMPRPLPSWPNAGCGDNRMASLLCKTVSSWVRRALSLSFCIASLFYSKAKQKQFGNPSLFSDDEPGKSLSRNIVETWWILVISSRTLILPCYFSASTKRGPFNCTVIKKQHTCA